MKSKTKKLKLDPWVFTVMKLEYAQMSLLIY